MRLFVTEKNIEEEVCKRFAQHEHDREMADKYWRLLARTEELERRMWRLEEHLGERHIPVNDCDGVCECNKHE